MTKVVFTNGFNLVDAMMQFNNLDASVLSMQNAIDRTRLLNSVTSTAVLTSLSAPVMSMLHAIPEIGTGVEHLPAAESFDIVPDHISDPRTAAALETLGHETAKSYQSIKDTALVVCANLGAAIDMSAATTDMFRSSFIAAADALEDVEFTEAEFAALEAPSAHADQIAAMFDAVETSIAGETGMEYYLSGANEEKVQEEVNAMLVAVESLGPVMGATMTINGPVPAVREADIGITMKSMSEHGQTKESLIFTLHRAIAMCDTIDQIADNRIELIAAMEAAAGFEADTFETSEGYSAADHFVMLATKASNIGRMIREGIILLSRVAGTASAVRPA